jgi:hypothetical protein
MSWLQLGFKSYKSNQELLKKKITNDISIKAGILVF